MFKIYEKKNNLIDGWIMHMNSELKWKCKRLLYKKMHNSYIIRKIEIKIILWSHFLLIRLAKVQKIKNIHCWQDWRETGPFHILLVGIYISTTPMEGSLVVSVKITNANMLWPSNTTSGNLSHRCTYTGVKWYTYNVINCSLVVVAKDWKQTTRLSIRALKINHGISIQWLKQEGSFLYTDMERFPRYIKLKKGRRKVVS